MQRRHFQAFLACSGKRHARRRCLSEGAVSDRNLPPYAAWDRLGSGRGKPGQWRYVQPNGWTTRERFATRAAAVEALVSA